MNNFSNGWLFFRFKMFIWFSFIEEHSLVDKLQTLELKDYSGIWGFSFFACGYVVVFMVLFIMVWLPLLQPCK